MTAPAPTPVPTPARGSAALAAARPALAAADPVLAGLIDAEERLQADTLRLIPSENYVSAAVLEASGTVLQNKYSEGYAGRRYYEGQQVIDQVETLAVERAKALFGMEHANVQPYSGSPPTSPSTWRSAHPATPSSAWGCRWAATSPTAGASPPPAPGSAGCATACAVTPGASTSTRCATWPSPNARR